jgi:ribosomal protein S18 acetylase RimI-like enzyme
MADIVRADAARIDELEPLWLALREHHGSVTEHWGPLRPAEDSWARRRKTYVDILSEGGTLFLAVEDGAPVGLAICEREEGGSPTWAWPPDFLALVDLIVLPGARGGGVGTQLLRAVEAEARERGVAAVALNVAAPNERARRFYERHGYRLDQTEYRKPLGD